MLRIEKEELGNVRNPGRPDNEAGIVQPMRTANPLFKGWGPKLIATAVALNALRYSTAPTSAAQVAMASCSSPSHAATLISAPMADYPNGVAGSGQTVLRVMLASTGRVKNIAVAQSSGNVDLDFAATQVAEHSRYAPAVTACQATDDAFLYSVDFKE
jgi:TonB family protein